MKTNVRDLRLRPYIVVGKPKRWMYADEDQADFCAEMKKDGHICHVEVPMKSLLRCLRNRGLIK